MYVSLLNTVPVPEGRGREAKEVLDISCLHCSALLLCEVHVYPCVCRKLKGPPDDQCRSVSAGAGAPAEMARLALFA